MAISNNRVNIFKGNVGCRGWVVSGCLLALVVLVWGIALRNIDVANITFDGLITALPFSYFLAFLILTISYLILISREQESFGWLFLHVLVLILITRGTLAIVYETPRYAWTYKVIGLVSYVQSTGSVDQNLGAYSSWPNFLVLDGFINAVAGIESPMSYAAWAQFFNNVLFFIAMIFIFRSMTTNWRRIWTALWLFYLASWVGHDSFVPQAINYFYYLMVMGITIRWFVQEKELIQKWKIGIFSKKSSTQKIPEDKQQDKSDVSQRRMAFVVLLLLYLVIVSGHQLTPFMVISGVLFLTLFVGHRSNTFSILLIVILGTWIMYVAWGFVTEFSYLVQRVLKIYENLYDSLFVRYNFQDIPREHWNMLTAGYLLTGTVWLLAFIGSMRLVLKGYREKVTIVLAISPFMMVFLFSYGGEALSRIFLFSLPWAVYLAAATLYPDGSVKFRWYIEGLASTIISIALFWGLILSYFGNEKINYFPEEEISVISSFYDEALPGSLLITPITIYPNKFVPNFYVYDYKRIVNIKDFRTEYFNEADVDWIFNVLSDESYPEAYFLVTSGQLNYIDKYNITPDGAVLDLLEVLLQSNKFEYITANSRGVLLKYIGEGVEDDE